MATELVGSADIVKEDTHTHDLHTIITMSGSADNYKPVNLYCFLLKLFVFVYKLCCHG